VGRREGASRTLASIPVYKASTALGGEWTRTRNPLYEASLYDYARTQLYLDVMGPSVPRGDAAFISTTGDGIHEAHMYDGLIVLRLLGSILAIWGRDALGEFVTSWLLGSS